MIKTKKKCSIHVSMALELCALLGVFFVFLVFHFILWIWYNADHMRAHFTEHILFSNAWNPMQKSHSMWIVGAVYVRTARKTKTAKQCFQVIDPFNHNNYWTVNIHTLRMSVSTGARICLIKNWICWKKKQYENEDDWDVCAFFYINPNTNQNHFIRHHHKNICVLISDNQS